MFVVWDRGVTIWDYDQAYDKMMYFEMKVWPVHSVCGHQCCPTSILMRVLRPVLMALTDKRLRARTIWHDIPETEIISALSEYGILKEMLPTEMGGDVLLDQVEWMANRRAVELEEIT